MSEVDNKPDRVGRLKELLLDELADQIENGVKVVDKDTGELEKISAGAPLLAVAAKVVKDWQDDIVKKVDEDEKTKRLSQFLAERRPDISQGPKAN